MKPAIFTFAIDAPAAFGAVGIEEKFAGAAVRRRADDESDIPTQYSVEGEALTTLFAVDQSNRKCIGGPIYPFEFEECGHA